MANHLKTTSRPKRWYHRPHWPAYITAITGVILHVVVWVANNIKNPWSWVPIANVFVFLIGIAMFVGAATWLLIIAIRESRAKEKATAEKEKATAEKRRLMAPSDLQGCALVLWRILRYFDSIPMEDSACLRITVHRVEKDEPDKLIQAIDYVGGRGGGEGREFSSSLGIIGLILRSNQNDSEIKSVFAKRRSTNHESFVKEMVEEWGYSVDEARNLTQDRASWAAVILSDDNDNPTGVLYLDSNTPDYFDGNQTREIIVRGAGGVAQFIRGRYN